MTQYARPDGSTLLDSLWLNEQSNQTNLHLSIDESSTDDSDLIANDSDDDGMGGGTTPNWAKFTLGDVDDPESASDHKVVYRAIGAGMMAVPSLIWSLRQGSTEIAGGTNSSLNNSSMWESVSAHTHTLSSGEANSITDYDDLQIWFKRSGGDMGDGVTVTQAWFECPDASAGGGVTTSPAFLLFVD